MTELQITIMYLMKRAGIVAECRKTVMNDLKTEEQQQEMLSFLMENPTVSNREVAYKLVEII